MAVAGLVTNEVMSDVAGLVTNEVMSDVAGLGFGLLLFVVPC